MWPGPPLSSRTHLRFNREPGPAQCRLRPSKIALDDLLIAEHLVRRTLGDDPPAVEGVHPPRDRTRQLHIMLDDHDRAPGLFGDALDDGTELLGFRLRQPRRG